MQRSGSAVRLDYFQNDREIRELDVPSFARGLVPDPRSTTPFCGCRIPLC